MLFQEIYELGLRMNDPYPSCLLLKTEGHPYLLEFRIWEGVFLDPRGCYGGNGMSLHFIEYIIPICIFRYSYVIRIQSKKAIFQYAEDVRV